jgi:hypothetical protein
MVVAMANPDDLTAIDDIASATGMRVRAISATKEEIDRAIAVHLDAKDFAASDPESFPVEMNEDGKHGRRP